MSRSEDNHDRGLDAGSGDISLEALWSKIQARVAGVVANLSITKFCPTTQRAGFYAVGIHGGEGYPTCAIGMGDTLTEAVQSAVAKFRTKNAALCRLAAKLCDRKGKPK